MTWPCELRVQREEAERLARREEYERSLDWQFAVISKAREERGERALTRSEWLAGCYGDEENGDVAPPPSRAGLFIVATLYAVAIIAAALDDAAHSVGTVLWYIVSAALLFGPTAMVLLLERHITLRARATND